jgi:hypothetical protein
LVWERIEARLDEKTKTKTIPLRTVWLAAASVVGVLVISYWLFVIRTNSHGDSLFDNTEISYSTEKFDKSLIVKPSVSIDKQCAAIEKLCETKANSCEKPAFKTLKKELDQLNAAHRQLSEAIGNYNTDPHLLAQLTDIETERADILKKLTAQI